VVATRNIKRQRFIGKQSSALGEKGGKVGATKKFYKDSEPQKKEKMVTRKSGASSRMSQGAKDWKQAASVN